MKIATTIGELYSLKLSPAEAIRCYQGTGFKYLDFSFYYAHKDKNSPYMEESDSGWKKEIENAIAAAEECGFKDEFYFSRIFKKYYHLSPKQYRREFNSFR